jgi:hypothetical protein
MTPDKSSFRDSRGEQVRGSEQTSQKKKNTTTSKRPPKRWKHEVGEKNQLGSVEQSMLTSPNAPLPITLTVLKSRKPIFVRRSLKNCDCVRVCLLISRIRRSSGTPARDLSSSAPLRHAIVWLQYRAEINHTTMNTANTLEQRFTSLWKHATHRMFKSIAVSSAKR